MNKPDEPTDLQLRARPAEDVVLSVPSDALAMLHRIAALRDMAPEALMKLYIGQGLRQDSARVFSERILETTAEVLARHIDSEEERSAILREIQGEAAA